MDQRHGYRGKTAERRRTCITWPTPLRGKPVAGANLEFFGFDVKHRRNNRTDIDVEQFAESTDDDGQVIVEERDQRRGFRWLVTARTDGGRFAFLGFSNVWYGRYHDP